MPSGSGKRCSSSRMHGFAPRRSNVLRASDSINGVDRALAAAHCGSLSRWSMSTSHCSGWTPGRRGRAEVIGGLLDAHGVEGDPRRERDVGVLADLGPTGQHHPQMRGLLDGIRRGLPEARGHLVEAVEEERDPPVLEQLPIDGRAGGGGRPAIVAPEDSVRPLDETGRRGSRRRAPAAPVPGCRSDRPPGSALAREGPPAAAGSGPRTCRRPPCRGSRPCPPPGRRRARGGRPASRHRATAPPPAGVPAVALPCGVSPFPVGSEPAAM